MVALCRQLGGHPRRLTATAVCITWALSLCFGRLQPSGRILMQAQDGDEVGRTSAAPSPRFSISPPPKFSLQQRTPSYDSPPSKGTYDDHDAEGNQGKPYNGGHYRKNGDRVDHSQPPLRTAGKGEQEDAQSGTAYENGKKGASEIENIPNNDMREDRADRAPGGTMEGKGYDDRREPTTHRESKEIRNNDAPIKKRGRGGEEEEENDEEKSVVDFDADECAYLMGGGGIANEKVERFSRCSTYLRDTRFTIYGGPEDRKLCRLLMDVILSHRKRKSSREIDLDFSLLDGRPDVSVIDVEYDYLGIVLGARGRRIRGMEDAHGTFCFFNNTKGNSGLRRLYILGGRRGRERVMDEVRECLQRRQSMSPFKRGGDEIQRGGYPQRRRRYSSRDSSRPTSRRRVSSRSRPLRQYRRRPVYRRFRDEETSRPPLRHPPLRHPP